MAAEIGNRLRENSGLRDAWTRRGEHPRARSSRPSNPFRFGSVFPSCRTLCADAGEARTGFLFRYPPTGLCRRCFVKHGDKHRRDILQEIFRFVALENGGVLPQLIGDLVDDELTFWLKRIVRLSQQCPFFIDFESAKWNGARRTRAVSARTATRPHRHESRARDDPLQIDVPVLWPAPHQARTEAD